jgi:acyl-CoA thioesterase I
MPLTPFAFNNADEARTAMDHQTLAGMAAIVLGVSVPCALAEQTAATNGAAADKAVYLKAVCAEMSKLWPSNRIVNIVCHGHSVPAGYFQTPRVNTFNAYPHLLHQGLNERYPTAVINVIVTAIGGEASESGAARFERDVLSLRPDVVTIDYALNDRGFGLERSRKAWAAMIEKAKAAGVKVILLTPTADMGIKFDDPNDPACQHAAQVRALAREYQVGLVDSFEAYHQYLKDGGKVDDLLTQYNHPNRKGHDLVAAELLTWFPR